MHQVRHTVHDGQFLDALTQLMHEPAALGLGAFTVPDVVPHRRNTDKSAARILDWRDCERDVHQSAVLGQTLRLIMVHTLATPNLLKNLRFLPLLVRWDEHGDRFSDGLCGGVAIEPLRTVVPTIKDAFQRIANDGVVAGLNNGREPGFAGRTSSMLRRVGGPQTGAARGLSARSRVLALQYRSSVRHVES